MKKCLIVYNPNSGKKTRNDFYDDMKKILLEHEYSSSVVMTKYQGHAMEIVEQAPHVDLLISIGGDGTFNEIMTGNLKR